MDVSPSERETHEHTRTGSWSESLDKSQSDVEMGCQQFAGAREDIVLDEHQVGVERRDIHHRQRRQREAHAREDAAGLGSRGPV